MTWPTARTGRDFLKSGLAAVALFAAASVAPAQPRQTPPPTQSLSPGALMSGWTLAEPRPMPAPEADPRLAAMPPIPLQPTPCPDGLFPAPAEHRAFEGMPNGLLWEPLLADKREPRFGITGNNHEDFTTKNTADTYIGSTFPLFRYSPPCRPFEIQVDSFGVVATRWSESNYAVAADYRAGVPITVRSGPWAGKFGWEHTSTHLGDETMVRTGLKPIDYEKDELVTGLSYVFEDRVRVYGTVSWAFYLDIPDDSNRFRYDIGCEVFDRRASPRWGQPFGAINVEFNNDVHYSPNVTVQAGWMWRKPEQRLGQFRVFGEYYTGHTPYGQLFLNKETAWALGVSLDY